VSSGFCLHRRSGSASANGRKQAQSVGGWLSPWVDSPLTDDARLRLWGQSPCQLVGVGYPFPVQSDPGSAFLSRLVWATLLLDSVNFSLPELSFSDSRIFEAPMCLRFCSRGVSTQHLKSEI
jgi:hypothetical protein